MAKQNHSTTKDGLSTAASKVENSTTVSVHTYPLLDYGEVMVDAGCATDFASRRAQQLHSLIMITQGGADFHSWERDIKDGILDLAADLANDLVHLIPLVQADAAQRKAASHGC